ncbi:MAG: hypothetical protein ACJAW7_001819 [Candidatus Azotimanducaceae bacterium]|jgi:hypothetical protein
MALQPLHELSGLNMKRIRLAPEDRRKQILEVAKQLLSDAGLQRFSFRHLAVGASVSERLLWRSRKNGCLCQSPTDIFDRPYR